MLELFDYYEESPENNEKYDQYQKYYEDSLQDLKILGRIYLIFIFNYMRNEIRLSDNLYQKLETRVVALNVQPELELPEGFGNYILKYANRIQKLDQPAAVKEINVMLLFSYLMKK